MERTGWESLGFVFPLCVVVAHPDDEVLWFGQLLLDTACDVYCCMRPKNDPQRIEHFFKVCQKTGSKAHSLGYFEMDHLELDDYKTIVTHNEVGEYGHPDHKFVHQYLVSNYENVITSGYGIGGVSVPAGEEKLDLIKTYDYQWNGAPRYAPLFRNWATRFNLFEELYIA